MDHWTFSAVFTQKRVNRNPADIGDLKNGFVSKIITLDLLITSRNLSNYAMIPPRPSPFQGQCFAFNKKMLDEKLSWLLIYLFQKFSASEEFFGVFIPLLGITVFAKSEKLGEKSLGNSPTTESNSSISSLFTRCTQSCFSYKCGKWYIELGRPDGSLLWLVGMIWLFQSSLTEFSSSLMIPIKQ